MAPKFQVVDQTTEPEQENTAEKVGIRMLLLGLTALSQRAIEAVASLFTLVTVGSAFWLWYQTPHPDVYQIISLTIYGLFVLSANWIVKKV
jgi:hypothetical protein